MHELSIIESKTSITDDRTDKKRTQLFLDPLTHSLSVLIPHEITNFVLPLFHQDLSKQLFLVLLTGSVPQDLSFGLSRTVLSTNCVPHESTVFIPDFLYTIYRSSYTVPSI